MLSAYLLLFLSFSLFAQPAAPKIEVMPPPKSVVDFEHEFKGCPENSECDQVMGLQMQRWKDLITKLEEDEAITPPKKAQFLELFRAKYGLPIEFYTIKKSQQGFKPMYYNSQCKEHNPKGNEELRVLKGISFVKALSNEKATIWRDQAQIEVPLGTLLTPQPVLVYYSETPEKYQLPLGDQPLYIKNKELIVLKEEDNFFYALSVSPKGEWKVENMDFTRLSYWEDKRENVTCPPDKTNVAPSLFKVEFCKTVWDDDLKKTVIVKMYQGCST
ncbi:MAG TPA: hypothetical protein VNJ08_04680 [Bacteriovoracaceae bacterium]|nr:hypothetical protein [Bacteriovoracaceae bacterium]